MVLRCLPLASALRAVARKRIGDRMSDKAPFVPSPASWFNDFSTSVEGEGGKAINDKQQFQGALRRAEKILVMTGAGVSAESGIPTFRGAGGLWRQWSATELATPDAFAANPSLVWEFYHYRRLIVAAAQPNAAHTSLATLQRWCEREGKDFRIVTQNIDGLHSKAGSKNIIELHGSLWRTRCVRCEDECENHNMPICPALEGKGAPDPSQPDARIPLENLPHCQLCNALLRPAVVWFNESLRMGDMAALDDAVANCDMMLLVGTSGVVQPAAGYAMLARGGGALVVEFNLEDTPLTRHCGLTFRGPAAVTLPEALGLSPEGLERMKGSE